MKADLLRHSLLLAASGCALSLSAQIPNGGFEDWADHGNYTEPAGWLTYNDVPTVGGPTVEAAAPGHPGNFHALITTRQSPGGIMAIQGWISAGSSSSHAGFPYTQRPAALTGQWQYNIQPGDTGQVLVAFSKWNGSSTEVIGQGTLEITGNISDWVAYSVPITYLSTEVPDTAYIQIVSSINFGNPVIGSELRVDDLAFSGVSAVGEQAGQPNPIVRITPYADRLLVNTPGAGVFEIIDASGRILAIHPIQQASTTLYTGQLPSGLLLYRFIANGGRETVTGKWVKE